MAKMAKVSQNGLKPRDIFVDPETGVEADFYANKEGIKVPYHVVDALGDPIPERDPKGNERIDPASGKPTYIVDHAKFQLRQGFDATHTAVSRYACENASMYEFDGEEVSLQGGKPVRKEQGWKIYHTLLDLAKDKNNQTIFLGEGEFVSHLESTPDSSMKEKHLQRLVDEGSRERHDLNEQLAEAQRVIDEIKAKSKKQD